MGATGEPGEDTQSDPAGWKAEGEDRGPDVPRLDISGLGFSADPAGGTPVWKCLLEDHGFHHLLRRQLRSPPIPLHLRPRAQATLGDDRAHEFKRARLCFPLSECLLSQPSRSRRFGFLRLLYQDVLNWSKGVPLENSEEKGANDWRQVLQKKSASSEGAKKRAETRFGETEASEAVSEWWTELQHIQRGGEEALSEARYVSLWTEIYRILLVQLPFDNADGLVRQMVALDWKEAVETAPAPRSRPQSARRGEVQLPGPEAEPGPQASPRSGATLTTLQHGMSFCRKQAQSVFLGGIQKQQDEEIGQLMNWLQQTSSVAPTSPPSTTTSRQQEQEGTGTTTPTLVSGPGASQSWAMGEHSFRDCMMDLAEAFCHGPIDLLPQEYRSFLEKLFQLIFFPAVSTKELAKMEAKRGKHLSASTYALSHLLGNESPRRKPAKGKQKRKASAGISLQGSSEKATAGGDTWEQQDESGYSHILDAPSPWITTTASSPRVVHSGGLPGHAVKKHKPQPPSRETKRAHTARIPRQDKTGMGEPTARLAKFGVVPPPDPDRRQRRIRPTTVRPGWKARGDVDKAEVFQGGMAPDIASTEGSWVESASGLGSTANESEPFHPMAEEVQQLWNQASGPVATGAQPQTKRVHKYNDIGQQHTHPAIQSKTPRKGASSNDFVMPAHSEYFKGERGEQNHHGPAGGTPLHTLEEVILHRMQEKHRLNAARAELAAQFRPTVPTSEQERHPTRYRTPDEDIPDEEENPLWRGQSDVEILTDGLLAGHIIDEIGGFVAKRNAIQEVQELRSNTGGFSTNHILASTKSRGPGAKDVLPAPTRSDRLEHMGDLRAVSAFAKNSPMPYSPPTQYLLLLERDKEDKRMAREDQKVAMESRMARKKNLEEAISAARTSMRLSPKHQARRELLGLMSESGLADPTEEQKRLSVVSAELRQLDTSQPSSPAPASLPKPEFFGDPITVPAVPSASGNSDGTLPTVTPSGSAQMEHHHAPNPNPNPNPVAVHSASALSAVESIISRAEEELTPLGNPKPVDDGLWLAKNGNLVVHPVPNPEYDLRAPPAPKGLIPLAPGGLIPRKRRRASAHVRPSPPFPHH